MNFNNNHADDNHDAEGTTTMTALTTTTGLTTTNETTDENTTTYANAVPAQAETIALEPTDLSNARILIANDGKDMRFCQQFNQWFIFDGKRFCPDNDGAVMRRAKKVTSYLLNLAAAIDDDDRAMQRKLTKWALATQSETALRKMIELAKSEPGIAVTPDQFDTNPWLLNVENGTINLKTGELKPHDRADLITKLVLVRYDPDGADADCPQFLAFLDTIMAGNADLIAYMSLIMVFDQVRGDPDQIN